MTIWAILAGVLTGAALADSTELNADVRDDVFYQFMPIAWRDSNSDTYRFGDFGGMIDSLDYLQQLGVTAVWMNPIFPSPAYHGYQHGPGDEVNPWFGTESDFLAFVSAAHARGIKVYVDFVVYGINQETPWFNSAYGNPGSPYDSWLAFTNTGNTDYQGYTFNTWNGDFVGFIHWDLRSAGPTNLVTAWGQKWLDPNNDGDPSDGIDGYRLDHVWRQYDTGPDGWGYNIDWWVAWKANLQAVKPNVFIFAEQANWGSTGAELLTAFDAAFTKPFEFAARDALANESAAPLYSAMEAAVASVPDGRTFVGIVGDHDVDRLASVIGPNMVKGRAAAAVLLTQPFPPCIYYGDEIGMLGTKQSYGTDDNDIPMREPFKWNAVAGPPMTNYWVPATQAHNNAFSADNDGRSVEEQAGVSGSLLETYRDLIGLRHANAALRRGAYFSVPNSRQTVWSFIRHAEGEQTVLVAINLSGSAGTTLIDLSNVTLTGDESPMTDVVDTQDLMPLTTGNQDTYPLQLSSYGFRIVEFVGTPEPPDAMTYDGRDIPTDFASARLVATQNTEALNNDNVDELNQLFVETMADGLRIGIPGNLENNGTGLVLLFDTIAGGQNPLDTVGYPDPYAISALDGTQFDAGFEPDHVIYINTYGNNIYVDQITLPTAASPTKTYRGSGTVNDGDGYLTGGTNPQGMQVAMDNTNTAGVTATDASTAHTARTGFEIFLPYAYIDVPGFGSGELKMTAFITGSGGYVTNQWLPGLGSGQTDPGHIPDVSVIDGEQFAVISLENTAGDGDGDGDVDLVDYARFADCDAGPGVPSLGPGCASFDLDDDHDVDLADFAVFQTSFGNGI